MAANTSNVSDWNPVLFFIVRQALLNATAIEENEDPSGPMYDDALLQLNGLVKAAELTGAHVWTEEEAIVFLQPGQTRYLLGGTGADHASDASDWRQLTLAAAAAAGNTLTVVDPMTAIAAQKIGVVLSSGQIQWTTIQSVVGATITLTAPLTGPAAAGAYAFVYNTDIVRPLQVPFARLYQYLTGVETPMKVLSRQQYMDLPTKTSPGVPTQFFYTPRRDQGALFVWPAPQLPNWAVRMTWYRPLQDFLIPTNTADFPQEWVLPLIWNLAKELAPSYGVPEATWQRIVRQADSYALAAVSHDRETEPVQFGMEWRR